GQYAQKAYLPRELRGSLTEAVRRHAEAPPGVIPLPHPAWRSRLWMQRHPWFEADVLPMLRRRIAEALRGYRPPQPIPCHWRIASIGQNSMTTFSVRLSRITHRVSSSKPIVSATLSNTGTRAATRKPAIIQPMSAAELTIESPL